MKLTTLRQELSTKLDRSPDAVWFAPGRVKLISWLVNGKRIGYNTFQCVMIFSETLKET